MRLHSGYTGETITKESVVKSVPPAWQGIVSKLIDDLFEAGWDGDFRQVKEKFGALRFYTGPTTDKQQELIDKAEEQTEAICIECGAPATHTTKGWYMHVCEEHVRS